MKKSRFGNSFQLVALSLLMGGWNVSNPAVGADLASPFSLETTQTLPGGVRNPRFINFYMSMDTRFNGDGGNAPLGDRLNKRISWNDVLQSQTDDAQKNVVLGLLKKAGLSADGSPGNASGEVKTLVNVKVPVLAFGVTDNLTLALVVPIIKADVSADTGFIRSKDGVEFVKAACELSIDKCNEAAAKLNEATAQKLSRLKYQPVRSETISGVGDVQLQSKYRFVSDAEQALAAKLVVTLPTGTKPNPDKALDITTGDARYRVGAAMIYDRELFRDTRWNVNASYTLLMPNEMIRRLPVDGNDSLSDRKEPLTRKSGDLVSAGTSLDYRFPRLGMVVGAGYSFQYLSKTRYSGPATDKPTLIRYVALEDLSPAQTLHSAVFTAGFSTVEWYQKKQFALPFQVNLAYSHPLAGMNSPTADVVAGEMVMFF